MAGRLRYISVPERVRISGQSATFVMRSTVFEALVLSTHDEMAWVQFQRKCNHLTEEFEPVKLKSYHTVLARDLRDEPFPTPEAQLTRQ